MKSEVTLNRILYFLLGMTLAVALCLGPAVLTGVAAPSPAPQGPGISVAITPAAAGLTLSQSVTLAATVTNDSSGKGVTWTVSGSSCSGSTCGTLTSVSAFSVTYTAPNTAGVYTVTATSVADNTRLSTATMSVTDLAGVYTYRNDYSRSSIDSKEYLLSPSNVNASSFGKLFACSVDQAIYAQPLWIANASIGGGTHNIVIVATEADSVYAFDADNGNGTACTQYWKASLTSTAYGAASGATPVPASDTGETGDIQTEIGITATPVIDPTTNTLYVLSKTKENGNYFQRLHKLNLSTGAEVSGAPVAITASVSGTGSGSSGGTLTYSALHENPRPGLALVNGSIYITAGSHGDVEPWHGWILQYNASTLAQTGVYCSTPNSSGGGIWMSGSAPVFDSSNNLYVITSNGTYDGNTEFGDTFLKMSTAGGLTRSDWFTPDDAPTLATDNGDLGAGGAVTLMDSVAGPYPHLVIGGGKEGILYLVNRDNMGHYNSSNNNAAIQTWQVAPNLGNYGGVSSSGEFWQNAFYIAGSDTPLEAFAFNTTTGTFNTTPTSSSNVTFGFPGITPAISALGTSNGIVWGIDSSTNGTNGQPSGPAVLYAFDPSNLAHELWDSTMGTNNQASSAVKFAVPTVANGKVYVATTNALDVYGLLTQGSAADAPTFSPAPGTYSSAQTVTLSDATSGATIYYTLDGTTPTTSSTVYSAPINVSATTTINAMAAASGLTNSTVSTATYTIGSASQAIAYVQGAYATPQSASTTVNVSFPNPQAAGDLNVVVVGSNDATHTVVSVSDSLKNSYALAAGPTVNSAGGLTQSIYYAKNVAGGTNTVTVTFSGATPYPDIRVLEYTGADLNSPLDISASATGSGATSTATATSPTTNANDLIFAANTVATITSGPGSGFTSRMITSPDGDIAEDRNVAATGTYSATANLGAGQWVMQMVAFKAAAGLPSDTTPPSAPSNLTATAVSDNQISLSWTASTDNVGVTDYLIERCQGSGCSSFAQVATSTGTTYSDAGDLLGATTFTYRVRATDAAGNLSGYSNVAGATTLADTTPPSVPTNVTANPVSTSQIHMAWNVSTDDVGVVGYNVQHCQGVNCTSFVQIASPRTNSVDDTGLSPATSYSYRVQATDYAGNLSGWSAVASATTPGVPTVSGISPNSGSTVGGTAVTITGANFASGATVTFGTAAATNVVVVSGTQITAKTPAGAAGSVTVTVTNPGAQSGFLANGFTYVVVPTVSSVSPNNGPAAGGTAVTITGTNFASGATVTFGTAAATNVVVVSGTQITAMTPANAAGAVTVTVTVSGQSGSLSNGFTYIVPPTVSSVAPSSGSTLGGTAVTITGANFASGATVMFGTAAATNVVVSGTQITATTPANAAGAVTVTVTNPGAQSGALTNGYTYVVVPTVSSVSPGSGPTAGGTSVTITGTNFASGATVTFGTAAATNVAVVSGTQITATTPANAAGAVTVKVTVSGQSGSLANGFTYTLPVSIGYAQVAAATPQSPTATVTVTYPAAQTAGDLNIVVVGWNDTTSTVQSVKDSAGNAYGIAVGPTVGSGLSQSIYYAANIVGGTNTVTVTFNQAAAYPDIRILEYRGVTTLDAKAGASGSSATANSGSATTNFANELIFGADMVSTWTTAAGSGFTSRIVTTPDSDLAEDKIVTTAGSNSATAGLGSGPWIMQMATFYAAAVQPSTPNLAGPAPLVQTMASYINSTALTTHTTSAFDSSGGDVIVVFASSHAGVTMTPSDSFNNTWISIAGPTNTSAGFDLRSQIWYAKNPTVGPGDTFTINLSAAQALVISVFVLKDSNVSSPIDVLSAIGDDGGTQSLAVASPNIVTTSVDDALIGFVKSSASEIFTGGAGYTFEPAASSDFLAAENENVLTPSTYNATFSLNTAATWQSAVVAVAPSPTLVTSSQISLSWSPSTDYLGVTGYLVERCQGVSCSNFTQIGTASGTSYVDTGLAPSTIYSYRVRAKDAGSNLSAYSNVVSASTRAQ